MARGRVEIEALARDGVAFHHDDEITKMADPNVPTQMPIADLARHLQELGRQHPDAARIAVTFAPHDLLRIARVIAPLGGGWPWSDDGGRRHTRPATRVGGCVPYLTSVLVGLVTLNALSLVLWLVS